MQIYHLALLDGCIFSMSYYQLVLHNHDLITSTGELVIHSCACVVFPVEVYKYYFFGEVSQPLTIGFLHC
jgi:hypothetical protein